MFDLNAIVSAAISAAITEATKPLLERIATLESANDILHRTQHEDMVAMRDRIAVLEEKVNFLEDQAVVTSNRIHDRITALETKLTEANLFTQMTPATPTTDITRHIIDALGNTDHPLFKRLSSFMDAVAEQAMDHHLECYNHDSYDEATSKVDDYDFDDFVKTDYLEDAVREAVSNLSFDISVS